MIALALVCERLDGSEIVLKSQIADGIVGSGIHPPSPCHVGRLFLYLV
jgi:hypothetical protein